ncbi:hypothetical protein YC2023_050578 [Brassica napus]
MENHLNPTGAIYGKIGQSFGEPDDVQTKPRHPGDIIHEPEEFYNFIPCTSPHRNKKIPIITKLPYLESQALKLQQLFFLQSMHEISTFQTIKKIPRKLTYPLKPSRYKEDTIYIHLAKILIIKPPTASFQGAIISFASKFIISSLVASSTPPSFHSNSFAKLESDTRPASKAPSQSTSIIN